MCTNSKPGFPCFHPMFPRRPHSRPAGRSAVAHRTVRPSTPIALPVIASVPGPASHTPAHPPAPKATPKAAPTAAPTATDKPAGVPLPWIARAKVAAPLKLAPSQPQPLVLPVPHAAPQALPQASALPPADVASVAPVVLPDIHAPPSIPPPASPAISAKPRRQSTAAASAGPGLVSPGDVQAVKLPLPDGMASLAIAASSVHINTGDGPGDVGVTIAVAEDKRATLLVSQIQNTGSTALAVRSGRRVAVVPPASNVPLTLVGGTWHFGRVGPTGPNGPSGSA